MLSYQKGLWLLLLLLLLLGRISRQLCYYLKGKLVMWAENSSSPWLRCFLRCRSKLSPKGLTWMVRSCGSCGSLRPFSIAIATQLRLIVFVILEDPLAHVDLSCNNYYLKNSVIKVSPCKLQPILNVSFDCLELGGRQIRHNIMSIIYLIWSIYR